MWIFLIAVKKTFKWNKYFLEVTIFHHFEIELCTALFCLFKSLDLRNELPQTSHWYGFSAVWISVCTFFSIWLFKSLMAIITIVRTIIGMIYYMLMKSGRIFKSFNAKITFKWTFIAISFVMIVPICLDAKFFIAKITGKWFFSRETSQVNITMRLLKKLIKFC